VKGKRGTSPRERFSKALGKEEISRSRKRAYDLLVLLGEVKLGKKHRPSSRAGKCLPREKRNR